MMRKPVVTIVLSLIAVLGISVGSMAPGSAETATPSPSASAEVPWPDESKPIMTYCSQDLYACDGYQPLSDEQYLPPRAPGFKNFQGYYHNDLAGLYRFASYAIAIKRDASGQATSVVACKDIAASDCTGDEISYTADLPMCSTNITIDCMRDITVTDADNKPLPFTIEGEFPVGNPQTLLEVLR